MTVEMKSRRYFLAGGTTAILLPATQAQAFAPFGFAMVRFVLGALAGGSIRCGAVASLLASGTTRAIASNAPRVSAAANLAKLAYRAPQKFARVTAEREAYNKRYSTTFAARGQWEARRAAQFADLALDGWEAMENVRTITSDQVFEKVGDEQDELLEAFAAYFLTLDRDDSASAKSYWIDAPENSAFSIIDARWQSSYHIEEIQVWERNDSYASVAAGVWAKNDNETWKYYPSVFDWALTDFGWMIVNQRSL